MNETIKQFFPLVLAILCTLCVMILFFYGFSNHSHGLFFDIGSGFSNLKQKDFTTHISEEMNAQQEPLPTLTYVGKTLTTGNAYPFLDLFQIESSTDTALYLFDVTSANGTSLLTTLSSSDIEHLEELPSPAVYDSDKGLLYFYQNGIYTLSLRLYHNHRPSVLYECQIPVETR